MDVDLRQAAVATTVTQRVRAVLVTATCCTIALIGTIMGFSYVFAGPPQPPRSCGNSGIYRTIVDPKPDNLPYITIICRNGESWFVNP